VVNPEADVCTVEGIGWEQVGLAVREFFLDKLGDNKRFV
jgi:hypothetical protein